MAKKKKCEDEIPTFGSRLMEIRKYHNETRDKLAEILFVHPRTVYSWEKLGRHCTDQALLIKIADHYNVTLDYLFGRE